MNSIDEIWICGRVARCVRDNRPLESDEPSWELLGVFSSRDKAAALCTDCRFYILPWRLDEPLPEGCDKPEGMEYPAPRHHVTTGIAATAEVTP